jgi:hypothetical protein
MGGPEVLEGFPAHSTETIDFLDGVDATSRFGTGNSAGAILVTSRAAAGGDS